jgi:hypothetical protein
MEGRIRGPINSLVGAEGRIRGPINSLVGMEGRIRGPINSSCRHGTPHPRADRRSCLAEGLTDGS